MSEKRTLIFEAFKIYRCGSKLQLRISPKRLKNTTRVSALRASQLFSPHIRGGAARAGQPQAILARVATEHAQHP